MPESKGMSFKSCAKAASKMTTGMSAISKGCQERRQMHVKKTDAEFIQFMNPRDLKSCQQTGRAKKKKI